MLTKLCSRRQWQRRHILDRRDLLRSAAERRHLAERRAQHRA